MEKSNKTRHWKLMRAHGKAKQSIEEVCITIEWKHCINSPGSCFVRRDLLLFGPRADPPLSVPLIITFASAAGDTDMFLYWGTFLDLCFIGYDATKSTFAFFRISLLQTFYYQSLQMSVKIFVFCICNLFEKLQAQMCVTGQLRKLPSSSQVGFECHKEGGSNQLKVKTSRRESGRAHFTN